MPECFILKKCLINAPTIIISEIIIQFLNQYWIDLCLYVRKFKQLTKVFVQINSFLKRSHPLSCHHLFHLIMGHNRIAMVSR